MTKTEAKLKSIELKISTELVKAQFAMKTHNPEKGIYTEWQVGNSLATVQTLTYEYDSLIPTLEQEIVNIIRQP